uniref:Uncharacterized protein n=1 Tax=Hyaloperonospora arabidopsidis (strain Emoy2) TaxID=559515 RepID=M4B7M7_HYAAE
MILMTLPTSSYDPLRLYDILRCSCGSVCCLSCGKRSPATFCAYLLLLDCFRSAYIQHVCPAPASRTLLASFLFCYRAADIDGRGLTADTDRLASRYCSSYYTNS